MIYTLDVYTVHHRNTSAFYAAFEEGPFQRLSWEASGHFHTGLHFTETRLRTTFFALGLWKTKSHYLNAEHTPEIREFRQRLKLLSTGYESLGAFRSQCSRLAAEVPTYLPFPVTSAVSGHTRPAVPKAS